MRKLACFLWLCLHMAFAAQATDEASTIPIGIGDELAVVVFNEPDLALQTKIGASGTIQMPLLGELKVTGSTPAELEGLITAALAADYLVDPQVTVTIKTFRPFYIKGEVTRAGAYEYVVGLTVDQAIAIAGGLKERASSSGWKITRGREKVQLKVSLESRVLPGDIITIPESFF